jgi:hypothetical protein
MISPPRARLVADGMVLVITSMEVCAFPDSTRTPCGSQTNQYAIIGSFGIQEVAGGTGRRHPRIFTSRHPEYKSRICIGDGGCNPGS